MSNRQNQIERLLRENQFTLQRQGKHLVYTSPRFREPYIVAATPSDVRATENQYAMLKRIIEGRKADAPMPRFVIDAKIRELSKPSQPQPLPKARKTKTSGSKGTGIQYIRKIVREISPEERAKSLEASQQSKWKEIEIKAHKHFTQSCIHYVTQEHNQHIDARMSECYRECLGYFDMYWDCATGRTPLPFSQLTDHLRLCRSRFFHEAIYESYRLFGSRASIQKEVDEKGETWEFMTLKDTTPADKAEVLSNYKSQIEKCEIASRRECLADMTEMARNYVNSAGWMWINTSYPTAEEEFLGFNCEDVEENSPAGYFLAGIRKWHQSMAIVLKKEN